MTEVPLPTPTADGLSTAVSADVITAALPAAKLAFRDRYRAEFGFELLDR